MQTEKHIVQKKTNLKAKLIQKMPLQEQKGKPQKFSMYPLPPESPLHASFPVAAAQIILSVIVNFS